MKQSLLKTLVVGTLSVLVVVGIAFAFSYALDKQEEVTCFGLQQQANVMQAFYITPLEKEMCDYHNIEINAPVEVHTTE